MQSRSLRDMDDEVSVKTEAPSPVPFTYGDDVKPDTKELDPLDKWRARVLFCRQPGDEVDGCWTKRIERQMAILRVSFPFLAEDQIRGKAWRCCGLNSVMGELPRFGLSPQVKKELRKFQGHNRVKLKLKSKSVKMETDDNSNNCLYQFSSSDFILNSQTQTRFRNLQRINISQESGIGILSNSSKSTSRKRRKLVNKTEKIEFEYSKNSIKSENNNYTTDSPKLSVSHNTLYCQDLFDVKGSQKIPIPSFTLKSNCDSQPQISQFSSSLSSYLEKIQSRICNDKSTLRENVFSNDFNNDSPSEIMNTNLDNRPNDITLKVTCCNLEDQSSENQTYISISQRSNISQKNTQNNISLDNQACYSSPLTSINLQNINNDLSQSKTTTDRTLSGLDNQVNSSIVNISCKTLKDYSSYNFCNNSSNRNEASLITSNPIYLENELSENQRYISTFQKSSSKQQNTNSDQSMQQNNIENLPTQYNGINSNTAEDFVSTSKQFSTEGIYSNVATNGSSPKTSVKSSQKEYNFIQSNNQLINNNNSQIYSLKLPTSQDSNEGAIFPPNSLLSNYSCEYHLGYTKKDLRPNLYSNYYTDIANSSLKDAFNEIIPKEQSLIEFFEAHGKSFHNIKSKVCTAVNKILFMLELSESENEI